MATALTLNHAASLTGGFQSYLNYVNSLPLLTEGEERDLFIRFQQQNDLEAARKIVLSHLRFVAYIAKSYSGYGLPLEDLVQQGSVGLMKSVKRFDLSKGVRLSSFAVHWIKAEIHEYVLRNWKLVKVATTKAQRKLYFNLRKMKKQLGWMNQNELDRIADSLDVDAKDVAEMESRLYQYDSYFDESFGESRTPEDDLAHAHGRILEDRSFCPENVIGDDFQQRCLAKIHQYLQQLDERASDILQSRWLADGESKTTLKALANKYDISMERVRQIESNTLSKLRQHLVAQGFDAPGETLGG